VIRAVLSLVIPTSGSLGLGFMGLVCLLSFPFPPGFPLTRLLTFRISADTTPASRCVLYPILRISPLLRPWSLSLRSLLPLIPSHSILDAPP
jgi:hypothetical protein